MRSVIERDFVRSNIKTKTYLGATSISISAMQPTKLVPAQPKPVRNKHIIVVFVSISQSWQPWWCLWESYYWCFVIRTQTLNNGALDSSSITLHVLKKGHLGLVDVGVNIFSLIGTWDINGNYEAIIIPVLYINITYFMRKMHW